MIERIDRAENAVPDIPAVHAEISEDRFILIRNFLQLRTDLRRAAFRAALPGSWLRECTASVHFFDLLFLNVLIFHEKPPSFFHHTSAVQRRFLFSRVPGTLRFLRPPQQPQFLFPGFSSLHAGVFCKSHSDTASGTEFHSGVQPFYFGQSSFKRFRRCSWETLSFFMAFITLRASAFSSGI